MDLSDLTDSFQRRFDRKYQARDRALVASRRAIRFSANAIRALHRGQRDEAHGLMDEARNAVEEGRDAVVQDHPDVYFAGFMQDAQKEYAEARLTEILVFEGPVPGPEELGVELAPYLNGMAETIGEGRRAVLDLLRRGEVERGERILQAMEDIYTVLVSMDYPDAMTGNLRRSTDVGRSILERTRGDLALSMIQRDLREALERHGRLLAAEE